MKTMKKVISVLLLVCVLASFATVSAYADGLSFNVIKNGDVYSVNSDINLGLSGVAAGTEVKWYVNNVEKFNSSTATSIIIKGSELGVGTWSISATAGDAKATAVSVTVKPTLSSIVIKDAANNRDSVSFNSIGDYVQLTAICTPSDAYMSGGLTWTSSDSAVAPVDANGRVTVGSSLTPGSYSATIRASAEGVTSNAFTVNITIPASTTKASSVSLSQSNITLAKGDTTTLYAVVNPNGASQSVSWSSDNTVVATVDSNGTVTGVTSGKAVITATATDGTGVKASCIVNVVDSEVATITVIPDRYDMRKGETKTFTYSVTGKNASSYVLYNWVSSNTSAISIDSKTGVATALAETTEDVRIEVQLKDVTTNTIRTAYANVSVDGSRSFTLSSDASYVTTGNKATVSVVNPLSNEKVTWNYTASPSDAITSVQQNDTTFTFTAGKVDGYVTVSAVSKIDGSTATATVYVNTEAPHNATITPSSVTWTKGQGNLEFTVNPFLFDVTMDGILLTGSANVNNSKYTWVYNGNLVLKSSYLATLSAGTHTLKVRTADDKGAPDGVVYATITINGTASAAYGDNAHVRGTSSNLYFNSNSSISKVYISNQLIDPANYTLSADGKTVTLKANFLNLLNYGSYTMKLENTSGGTETATFRIVTANYAPATGDDSNLAIWVAVMLISGVGAFALIPRRKKEM